MVAYSPVVAFSFRPLARMKPLQRDVAHLSDEALVALAARGEDAALAALYDRYGGVAYGLAVRIVRDPTLAEDAVQEAFLTVWRSAGRYLPERSKASSWILTIVHRRAVDVVRREERRRSEPLAEPPPPPELTDDAAWLRLERERVQEALKSLPDQQREALELAYYGASPSPSSPIASASRSARSRVGCSPAFGSCVSC